MARAMRSRLAAVPWLIPRCAAYEESVSGVSTIRRIS